jgi:hypothetical protein
MPATMTRSATKATEILIRVWERREAHERAMETADRDGDQNAVTRHQTHRDVWGVASLLLNNDGTARDAVPFVNRMDSILKLALIERQAAHLRCLGDTWGTDSEETAWAAVHAWADVAELMAAPGPLRDDVRSPFVYPMAMTPSA